MACPESAIDGIFELNVVYPNGVKELKLIPITDENGTDKKIAEIKENLLKDKGYNYPERYIVCASKLKELIELFDDRNVTEFLDLLTDNYDFKIIPRT